MCGICGIVSPRLGAADVLAGAVGRMAAALEHRGPDDAADWSDAADHIALGHRRLSIIDLSPMGRQPMVSASGRYVLALNGEIYNHRELREELRPRHAFRGGSDTEVLLAAIEAFGLVPALQRCVGMFALAVWDRERKRLHLARDRMGEKPLYYGWHNGSFLFASELKSLVASPDWRGAIDPQALALFFRFNFIPAPFSIYQGIRKLLPGTTLTVDTTRPEDLGAPEAYWSQREIYPAGPVADSGDENVLVDRLEQLLGDAVAHQMIADVPVGALLSGGTDSTTVAALMQARASGRVRTFTIGFNEDRYNEAHHARDVAAFLGTDHHELYVTPRESMDVIPLIPRLYDEPFADSSQIPTYLVSRLARQHVTVALSGDGADELFGGYYRYFAAPRLWRTASRMPAPLRRLLAGIAGRVPRAAWDVIAAADPRGLRGLTSTRLAERAARMTKILGADGPDPVYASLVSIWQDTRHVVGVAPPETIIEQPERWPPLSSFEQRMMFLDAMTYLPDDILVKVDRAAMASGLETRLPFLDHRVVEFAASLPVHMKIRDGRGKHLLKQLLARLVPPRLTHRPKMGFAVPVSAWVRGPLRGWAEDLLDRRAIQDAGLLNPVAVRHVWESFLAGDDGRFDALWAILMFQSWHAATMQGRAA